MLYFHLLFMKFSLGFLLFKDLLLALTADGRNKNLGIMGAPFSFTGNVWSETAAMLGYGGGESITVPVSIKTMESSTPYMCAGGRRGLRAFAGIKGTREDYSYRST